MVKIQALSSDGCPRWMSGVLENDMRQFGNQLSHAPLVLTAQKQKKPASEERWKDYGLNLKWGETWQLKSRYTTPRDIVALLQLQHRNLYVAKSLGLADTRCRARGCKHATRWKIRRTYSDAERSKKVSGNR